MGKARLTLVSALTLLFSAVSASAFAVLPSAGSENPSQSTDAPVDCKKTPEHPRCADKKK